MKTHIQNSIVVLFTVITIALAAVNPVYAQDQETPGLIGAADLAFIQAEPQGVTTAVANLSQGQSVSLISTADLAFISQPFSITTGGYRAGTASTGFGLITAADYQFIAGGEASDVFAAYNDLSDSLAGGLAE